jgi:predicted nucleic acid-binding protein
VERLTVVSNASPLIALAQVNLLARLEPLFVECLIPPAVAREIAPSVVSPAWIHVRDLTGPIDLRVRRAGLDPGETEAISLALELREYVLVLDDRPARRLATTLDLPHVGTLALLVAAKRNALVPAVRPIIDALLDVKFRASPRLIAQILAEAGE